MQPDHHAKVSDVNSFSTNSDRTKGQQQRKGEGKGKDVDMVYKST
jgi:hypothetical protein